MDKLPKINGSIWVTGQFCLLAMYLLTPAFFHWNTYLLSQLFAIIMMLVGFFLAALAFIQMRRFFSVFPEPKRNGYLLQRGAFSVCRHPMYAGLLLLLLGYALFWADAGRTVVTIACFFWMYYKARFEEQQLVQRYSDYSSYQLNVRMFPWIR